MINKVARIGNAIDPDTESGTDVCCIFCMPQPIVTLKKHIIKLLICFVKFAEKYFIEYK